MDRIIIFIVGAVSAMVSEVFWKGEGRWSVALWGGAGMLLLRRLVLRFPFKSRALLCIFGALLLFVIRILLHVLQALKMRRTDIGAYRFSVDMPSFSYGLYRFLLIALAYALIEYLETFFAL